MKKKTLCGKFKVRMIENDYATDTPLFRRYIIPATQEEKALWEDANDFASFIELTGRFVPIPVAMELTGLTRRQVNQKIQSGEFQTWWVFGKKEVYLEDLKLYVEKQRCKQFTHVNMSMTEMIQTHQLELMEMMHEREKLIADVIAKKKLRINPDGPFLTKAPWPR